MTSVSSGSYLNLAATASSDASEGLFGHEKWKRNTAFHTSVLTGSDGDLVSCFCFPTDWFQKSVLESPLLDRACALQEWILAPRVVHFTPFRVVLGM